MRGEFAFSASYKAAIDEAVSCGLATQEDKLAWYDGIIGYALTGIEPKFGGVCAVLWNMAKVSIDKSNAEDDMAAIEEEKAAARSERGRRMANARWQNEEKQSNTAQHDAHSMMHTASCTQHNACSIMHTASCTQHDAHSMMHAASEKKKEKEKESPNVSLSPTPPITSLPIEKEIKKEKEGIYVPRENFLCSSDAEHPSTPSPRKELSKEFLSEVVDMWNSTCVPHMPRLIDIKGTRRDKLRLRLMELGGEKEETDWLAWLRELFDKCAHTPFLWGKNGRGWRCDFGWLVANDLNWRKVMEGKYDGSAPKGYDTGVILTDNDIHKFDNEEAKWK